MPKVSVSREKNPLKMFGFKYKILKHEAWMMPYSKTLSDVINERPSQ